MGEAGSLFALGPVLGARREPAPRFPCILFYAPTLTWQVRDLDFGGRLEEGGGRRAQIWYSQPSPSSRALLTTPRSSDFRVPCRSLSQLMLLREVLRDTEGVGSDRQGPKGPPSHSLSMSSSKPGWQKAWA